MITRLLLPPAQPLSADTLAERLEVGDIVLCAVRTRTIGRMIKWGQRHILKRFGLAAADVEALVCYTHTVNITHPRQLLGVEAILPRVRETQLARDYGDCELLVLRGQPLDMPARMLYQAAARRWTDVPYDWKQYATYPFYMAFGWVPAVWAWIWDDEHEPVCSGLSIRLLQATGQLKDIKRYREYPPARLPVIPELSMVLRTRIIGASTASRAASRPWWLAG